MLWLFEYAILWIYNIARYQTGFDANNFFFNNPPPSLVKRLSESDSDKVKYFLIKFKCKIILIYAFYIIQ